MIWKIITSASNWIHDKTQKLEEFDEERYADDCADAILTPVLTLVIFIGVKFGQLLDRIEGNEL